MTTYHYRRELTRRELLPAIGAGVAAGVAVGASVAYLAQIWLRRTPLRRPPGAAAGPEIRVVRG